MHRKTKMIIGILMCTILLFTACEQATVDLSNILIPDSVDLIGNVYRDKIVSLEDELKKSRSNNNKEAEVKISNQIIEYTKAATLHIEDKQFIELVFGDISKLKATVINANDKSILSQPSFTLTIGYYNNNASNLLRDGYLSNTTIFDDGTIVLSMYDEKSKMKFIFAKAMLSKQILEYMQTYYKEHNDKINK